MLLDDDVMTERKAEPGPFSCRFGREEGVEYLLSDLRWNPGTVIADCDFDLFADVFRCCRKRRLVVAAVRLRFALGSGVKSVRDQVEQNPSDFLREDVDLASRRIERSLQ